MRRSLVVLAAALCFAAATSPAQTQSLDDFLEKVHQMHRLPSLVAAVVNPGGTVYVKALGWADVEAKKKATSQTPYRIASLTKVFITTLMMQLRDDGVLRLDDPLADFLPKGVLLPTDPRGAPAITLRHLAQHTSGLPERPIGVASGEVYYWGDLSAERVYARLAKTSLAHPIGSEVLYSNLGMGLLGLALERAGKKPLATLLQERIFAPLGMTRTQLPTLQGLTKETARGYGPGDRPARLWDLGSLNACGGMVSTVEDMAKFIHLQLRAGEANVSPLDGGTLSELHRPQFLLDGWRKAIGLGWIIDRIDGLGVVVRHNGGMAGYRTHMSFSPAERVGVVLLTNSGIEPGRGNMRTIGRDLLREGIKSFAEVAPPLATVIRELPPHFTTEPTAALIDLFDPGFVKRIPASAINAAFAAEAKKHGRCVSVGDISPVRSGWRGRAKLKFEDGQIVTCEVEVSSWRPHRVTISR